MGFLITRKNQHLKNNTMTIGELNNAKIPIVRIDKTLEKFREKVLFPKELAIANKLLSKTMLLILE